MGADRGMIEVPAVVMDLPADTQVSGAGRPAAAGQWSEGRRTPGAAASARGAPTPSRPAEAGSGRPGPAGGPVAPIAQGALGQLLRHPGNAAALAPGADRRQLDPPPQGT